MGSSLNNGNNIIITLVNTIYTKYWNSEKVRAVF